MNVEIRRVSLRLRTPWQTSAGSIPERDLLLLRLHDARGHMGQGEAAPLQSYDGVSLDDARAALEDCRGVLSAADGSERVQLLAECARLAVLPQALAAVDVALWDLAGRRAGRPVWHLLDAPSSTPVEVNHTLMASDRAGAAREAAGARELGFSCLKAKVGLGDDAGRLAAIRAAAGPEMAIRLDANGCWSLEEAQAALGVLEPVGLELCEEPVRGPDEIARLARLTPVSLALDESAAAPGALDRRSCTAVCLKISRCGGISGVLEAAVRARAAGYEVYLASTLDGPVGIAAALHAAAAVNPDRPCGLATLSVFEGRRDPFPPRTGRIALPEGPGLGDGLHAWYADADPA
ncbi:MAG: mandelate racemase/muconate lactonizing enzyme family protein [Solirubrobacteraceae bacterium]